MEVESTPLSPTPNGVSFSVLTKTISKLKKSAKRAYLKKNVVADDHYFWAFRMAMLCPSFLCNTISISPFLTVHVEKELNFFVIYLTYGNFEWSVKKKFGALFRFHAELKSIKFGRRDLPSLPDFPLDRSDSAAIQSHHVQVYLERLVANFTFTNVELDILQFLNVSSNSFCCDTKPIELKFDAHHLAPKSNKYTIHLSGYNSVYGVIYDSCIALFSNPWSTSILALLLFNQNFKIDIKSSKIKKNKIKLTNYSNTVRVKLGRHEYLLFTSSLYDRISNSIYGKYHRFGSFAPIRQGGVAYYIDASNYFKALIGHIESATKSIYISDWWLTPELYLLRPYADNEHSRLDRVLLRAAERNVSIYILVFKEMNLALPNDSEHTKLYLNQLHRNIYVQRHPDHFSSTGSLMWSHHEKIVVVDELFGFVGGIDLCLGRWTRQEHALFDDNINLPGQDYNNIRIKDFIKVRSQWSVDNISRDQPRMPWHDVHSRIEGESVLDMCYHFIQYWNHAKLGKTKREVPFMIPPNQHSKRIIKQNFVATQVLRSASPWSIGQPTEKSILAAYVALIRESQHFIYMENQFFVSNTSSSEYVKNTVAKELVDRIIRAYKEGTQFRVFLLIPLVPGFTGELSGDQGNTSKFILQFQYSTISKGDASIYSLLQKEGIDSNVYFRVFGLRNYAKKNNIAANEQIYIHSKLLIVDDRRCLLGSANINDRSLLGNRDSEIAVLSEYTSSDYLESVLHISNPIKQLRMDLWKEHLGEIDPGIVDPASEEAWGLWAIRANSNSNIYRTVFNPYPDDLMKSYKDIQRAGKHEQELTEKELSLLDGIKGHVVEYPIWFLCDEKQINNSSLTMETLAPGDLFI
eukprot:NODE_76_length_23341_cov_0.477498.p4 type:complete len:861 gc:universal NODE_76_length_23341_cov_0.477498:16030-13448(-)